MSPVHPSAAQGFAAAAEAYVRGRPSYPEALSRWLAGALALGPGSACVDLGAGTGKFTRLLARTGAAVTAVEPVFPHRHEGSPGAVIVDRTLSVSFIAALPEPARAEVERRLQALIAGHPDLRGRDTIAAPYHTQAYRCFKIG